jgi:hypothetical protein
MSIMRKIQSIVLALSVVGLLLTGCGPKDEGKTVSVSATQEQDYIKRIQDDPNMPAPAKAAAIKNMQEQQERARLAAQGRPQ